MIENAIYFNEAIFLCIRYLLHLDHTTKKIQEIYVYSTFHQFI
jgi:hypothetical protein